MFRKFISILLSFALIMSSLSPAYAESTSSASSRVNPLTKTAAQKTPGGAPGTNSSIEAFLPDLFHGTPKVEIPLLLPPLRSRLKLSLNPQYSFGQRGILGYGWDISIPKIARKRDRGINYNSNSFVLSSPEGAAELVEVSAGVFNLVSDDKFIKVDRSIDGGFLLTNREGTVTRFGRTRQSRLYDPGADQRIFSWMANQIEDRDGNIVDFDYENLDGSPYLVSVTYGSKRDQQAVFKVALSYKTIDATPTTFELGFATSRARLLDELIVRSLGTELRRYKFEYSQERSTGNYVLASVIENAGSRFHSRRYSMKYNFSEQFGATAEWQEGPKPVNFSQRCLTGNFAGHGRTDFACYLDGGNWEMGLSDIDQWHTEFVDEASGRKKVSNVWREGPAIGLRTDVQQPPFGPKITIEKSIADFCFAGDFEGKGRTGIACYTGGGKWQVALSNGVGWRLSTWANGATPASPFVADWNNRGTPVSSSCTIGDFVGHGRAAIACHVGNGKWQVSLSNGSGWSTTIWDAGASFSGAFVNSCVAADFDGSGRTSIACRSSGTNWRVAISTGSSWLTSNWDYGPDFEGAVAQACFAGNWNGGTSLGIACFSEKRGEWQVASSTGRSWTTSAWRNGPVTKLPLRDHCIVGNFNGDTKTGIACYTGIAGDWNVAFSTGVGWSSSIRHEGPSTALPVGSNCMAGDFTGWAKTRVACYSGGGVFKVWLSEPTVTATLKSITFPTGLELVYSYDWLDPSTQTLLPSVYPVVSGLNIRAGGTSPDTQVTFSFMEGYFDALHQEFRGFGRAVVKYPRAEDGDQKTVAIAFHQGATGASNNSDFDAANAVMKGRIYSTVSTNKEGLKLESSTIDYLIRPGLSTVVLPAKLESDVCDGFRCYLKTQREFEYDEYGNNTKETTARRYDADFSLVTVARTFEHDMRVGVLGILKSESISDEQTRKILISTQYNYDEDVSCGGDLIKHARGRFALTSIVAAPEGRKAKSWYAYDQYGNLLCRRLPEGGVFKNKYDASGNWLISILNPLGFVTRFEYYGIEGVELDGGPVGSQKSISDVNGNTILNEYDNIGRKIRETLPTGGWTNWDYAQEGNIQLVHSLDATGEETYERRDGMDRIVSILSRGPGQRWFEMRQTYNEAGRPATRSGPVAAGKALNPTIFKYDVWGRLFEIIDPDENSQKFCYWEGETVGISPVGEISGKRIGVHGSTSEVYVLARDSRYKTSNCKGLRGASKLAKATFEYDAAGRLISLARNDRIDTEILYNDLGLPGTIKDTNNGTTTMEYDGNGRIVSSRTVGGVAKFTAYDLLGRPVQVDYGNPKPVGQGDVRYEYDEGISNGRGQLTRVVSAQFARAAEYDSLGNITSDEYVVGAERIKLRRSFDMKGRLVSLNGFGLNYTFEYEGGLLRSVREGDEQVLAVGGVSTGGQPTSYKVKDFGSVSLKYHDPVDSECGHQLSRLCKVAVQNEQGQPLFLESYGYDADGRISEIQQLQQITKVVRDDFGRVSAIENSSTGSDASFEMTPSREDESFSYDSFGRIVRSSSGGTYQYDAGASPADGPTKVGENEINYRADGKVLKIGQRTFTYSERGLLEKIATNGKTTEFKYDSEGKVVSILSEGKDEMQFLGNEVICTHGKCRLRLKIGPIFIDKGDRENKKISVSDALGTMRLIGRPGQLKADSLETFATFGRPISRSGVTKETRVGMSGADYSPEESIYLLRERAFDPVTSMFLAPDPIQSFKAGSALSGKYVYANGDPFTYHDPNGQFAWFVPIIIGVILGAGTAAANGGTIEDVLRGAAMGAIGGAFYWVGVGLGGNALAFAFSGAAAGSTNAALFGGDIGQAATAGFLMGGLSSLMFSSSVEIFGKDTGLGGSLDYTVNSSLRGAATGGAYAAFTGRDLGEGIRRGASSGAFGALFNMAFGHVAGFAITGSIPKWDQGAWIYKGNQESVFTIGNVVTGNKGIYTELSPDGGGYNPSRGTELMHELGHISQSATLGVWFVPTALITYGVGGAWASYKHQDFMGGTHKYGFIDNDSGYIDVPSYRN